MLLPARSIDQLGWYPADFDDESIARNPHRLRLQEERRDLATKWVDLTGRGRWRDVEAQVRAGAAD